MIAFKVSLVSLDCHGISHNGYCKISHVIWCLILLSLQVPRHPRLSLYVSPSWQKENRPLVKKLKLQHQVCKLIVVLTTFAHYSIGDDGKKGGKLKPANSIKVKLDCISTHVGGY